MVDVLKSFIHLIFGSARMAVNWMGTTALAVVVSAVPSLARLVVGYRQNRWPGVKEAVGSASWYAVKVWAILFFVGMARFIYQDHTSLKNANVALSEQNKQLLAKKPPFLISFDNEYASITNTA
jgi:hypothetical protein